MDKRKKATAWVLIMIVAATASTTTTENPMNPTVTTTTTEKHITTTTTTSMKPSGKFETITFTTTIENTTSISTVQEPTATIPRPPEQPTTVAISTTTTPKPINTSKPTATPNPTTTTTTTTTPKPTTTRKPSPREGPLNLTPLLDSNQITAALSRAQVHHPDLTEKSYAGYFTTHESANSSSFFWYFPAKVDSERAPVVVYLEGILSMTVAFSIFVRNGPLIVDSAGRLGKRQHSWNNNHNMLYIDTAACSGYSFNQRVGKQSALEQVALEVMEAVKQFLKMFPALRNNDLYVAGDSFAAQLVITTANVIENDNQYYYEKINLKGIAIGHGLFASKQQFVFSNILYNLGLVDSKQRETFETEELNIQRQLSAGNPEKVHSIMVSTVLAGNSHFHNVTAYDWPFNLHDTQRPAAFNYPFANWVNRPDVRRALHVGDNNIARKPDSRITDIFISEVIMSNVASALYPHSYRVLIYTGNLDIVCSYASIRNWLKHTSQAEGFNRVKRQLWRDRRGELAGYTKTFGKITEILVRNAGHFSSVDQPQRINELLEDFTHGVTTTTSTTTTPRPTTTASTTSTAKPTNTTSTTTTAEPTTTTSTTTTAKPTNTTSTTSSAKPTTTTSTATTAKPTNTTSTTTTAAEPTTTTSTMTTTEPTTNASTTTTPKPTTTREPSAGPALYLTPLLNRNQIEEAQSQARVNHTDLTEESYAGYFTVNETDNSHLFFWYFPAKVNSERAPVVLYIEGDLGKTAAFSIFVRNGPLLMDSTGQPRECADSWNENHNMLYIDTAVATGFSFRDGPASKWRLMQVGDGLAEAVHQFFKLFPNLQRNEFFVAGESFAATLVATVAKKIHHYNGNLEGSGGINLKGIAIGNGVIAPNHQFVFNDILYNLGLVDSKQRKHFETKEAHIRTLLRAKEPLAAKMHLQKTILNEKNTLFRNVTGYRWQYNLYDTEPPETYNSKYVNWVERIDVRTALHVGDNVFTPYNYEMKDILMLEVLQSEGKLFIDLLKHYRVLIYTGNLDIICSYSSVRKALEHMLQRTEFKYIERQQWRDRSQELAGYTKKFGNLSEVLVRNAGHFSSIDQPQRTRELLENFTHQQL